MFFKESFKYYADKNVRFCVISLTVICILSCGTFVVHLGWGQFYTAVIVGLGYAAIRKVQNEKGLANDAIADKALCAYGKL